MKNERCFNEHQKESGITDSNIDFANWILKQNLMIVETLKGNVWKETIIGGRKYTSEELYLMYKKNLK